MILEYQGDGGKDEPLVTWDGDGDPSNPKNFSGGAKCFILAQVSIEPPTCVRTTTHSRQIGILTFIVTASSSIFSGGIPGVMDHFDCGPPVAALGLSLFVAGYGIGPMVRRQTGLVVCTDRLTALGTVVRDSEGRPKSCVYPDSVLLRLPSSPDCTGQ